MTKLAIQWSSNAAKDATLTAYNDSTVTYSSATVAYSNPNAALADDGKLANAWTDTTKTATNWSANSQSISADTYDPTGVTYDTIFSFYDGNQDTTRSQIGTVAPTAWSEA